MGLLCGSVMWVCYVRHLCWTAALNYCIGRVYVYLGHYRGCMLAIAWDSNSDVSIRSLMF